MFTKVLVANRGEIAIRVMRALEEMEIASVGVYSELDRDALHVERADEAYLLGPGPAAESYLKIEKILEVAVAGRAPRRSIRATASWPRTPRSRRACAEAGITFIGPPAEAIEAMGSKTAARAAHAEGRRAHRAGHDRAGARPQGRAQGDRPGHRLPVAVKAAGGGGGKGFRVALSEDELEDAFEGASREGEKFFSDPTVYLERYLPDPRHVEVQVLADTHGNVIHLGERDCSVQRRHQKLIEESPAPAVDEELRRAHREDRHRRRGGRELRRGRHHRGAARRWGVLLPRDEHPRAGRALRDRDDHGHRHRPRGHPGGRGRVALRQPGRRRAARACHRVPHQRRGRLEELRARPGADRSSTASPRGPGCASTPVWPGSESLPDVRPDGRQADRVGRRPRDRRRGGCCARFTSTRSTA